MSAGTVIARDKLPAVDMESFVPEDSELPVRRYRLLVGSHCERETRTMERKKRNGETVTEEYSVLLMYKAGDEFDSRFDLLTQNGRPPLMPKYELVHGPAVPAGRDISSMSDEDIEAFLRSRRQKFDTHGDGKPEDEKLLPSQKRRVPGPLSTEDDFDVLTVEELKQVAVESDIDLGGASKKADIIKVLREHRAE